MSKSIQQNIIICVSTCFKLGFFSRFPGTLGSLAALLFLPLITQGNHITSITLLSFLFILGTWAASEYAKTHNHDPSEVIIDEFVGMLLTLYIGQIFTEITFIFSILLFIAFRIFDILKPWPISWIDREVKGGFGIMLDDIAAGAVSGLLVGAIMKWVI